MFSSKSDLYDACSDEKPFYFFEWPINMWLHDTHFSCTNWWGSLTGLHGDTLLSLVGCNSQISCEVTLFWGVENMTSNISCWMISCLFILAFAVGAMSYSRCCRTVTSIMIYNTIQLFTDQTSNFMYMSHTSNIICNSGCHSAMNMHSESPMVCKATFPSGYCSCSLVSLPSHSCWGTHCY